MKLYLLNHARKYECEDTYKLIGVFSKINIVKNVIEIYNKKTGFKNYPMNYFIEEYELDKMYFLNKIDAPKKYTITDKEFFDL